MGADQSTGANAQLKSQRDEDIPYTSYTISKPIDGDTPRSSPRLTSKARAHLHKEYGQMRDSASPKHDIVVVKEGAVQEDTDKELQKLEKIPLFLPILRGSLNIPNIGDSDMLDRLDTRQVLQLCARYQEHLKQCSEAVAFDQNALCVRIKEVDYTVHQLYNALTERQKRFAKYAEQIQKVQEMHNVLNKVKMNVEQTLPLMERLNSVLPPSEQLEPFSMKPQSST